MKILAYGIREDEKPFVKEWEQENPEVDVEITDQLLDDETVAMAKGFDGVVVYQQKPYTDTVLKSWTPMAFTMSHCATLGLTT